MAAALWELLYETKTQSPSTLAGIWYWRRERGRRGGGELEKGEGSGKTEGGSTWDGVGVCSFVCRVLVVVRVLYRVHAFFH